MKLQQRLLVFILPLIFIPIALFALFSYQLNKEAKFQLESVQLGRDVQGKITELQRAIEGFRRSLFYLAAEPELAQLTQQPSDKNLQEHASQILQRYMQVYPEIHGVRLYDNNGEELLGLGALIHNGDYKAGFTFDSDWQFAAQDDQLGPAILAKVMLPKASSGFLLLKVRPNWAQLLDINAMSEKLLIILSIDGKVMFSYPQYEFGKRVPNSVLEQIRQSLTKDGLVDLKVAGESAYFATELLDAKYFFVMGNREQDSLTSNTDLAWLTIIVLLLSTTIAILLVAYTIRQFVTGPIDRLASAKQQVAQGKLDVRLETNGRDEFAELFASFNVMVRQLVVYREKERDSRLRLEYKVKERTEELETANHRLASTIKELEHARSDSDQASAMKSAFVANMSHEIRTPLTAILGFTERVIADGPKNQTQMDLLGRILRSGKHLLSLINNVLDLSKIEANKLQVEVTDVDLFELCNDVASLLVIQASEKHLTFELNYQYPLPKMVRTDEMRLKQVMLNLASNAIKFTEQGFVRIDVSYNDVTMKVDVAITDSGIGMEQDVLDSLFSPFTQADTSISRRFGGTGLGLVISRSLAKLLGGDIKATSQVGVGSRFTFDFDVCADQHHKPLQFVNSLIDLARDSWSLPTEKNSEVIVTDKKTAPVKKRGNVLIAEDIEDNRYLFSLLLDTIQIDYQLVENGEQAVSAALEGDFDLILMDMQMPVMDGLEATKLIRAAGLDMPIYALTANVMKEDLIKHTQAGCHGTIAKPIDQKAFLKLIERIISGKEIDNTPKLDPTKLDKLKNDYVDHLIDQAELLKHYLDTANTKLLRVELHKIKGSAGSFELNSISELAGEIEKVCLAPKALDWAQIKYQTEALLAEIDSLKSQRVKL